MSNSEQIVDSEQLAQSSSENRWVNLWVLTQGLSVEISFSVTVQIVWSTLYNVSLHSILLYKRGKKGKLCLALDTKLKNETKTWDQDKVIKLRWALTCLLWKTDAVNALSRSNGAQRSECDDLRVKNVLMRWNLVFSLQGLGRTGIFTLIAMQSTPPKSHQSIQKVTRRKYDGAKYISWIQ